MCNQGAPPSPTQPSALEHSDELSSPMQTVTLEFDDHIVLPSPTKSPWKYQSQYAKHKATATKWKALLPLLLPQYANLMASRSVIPTSVPNDHHPTTCVTASCKQCPSILKVLCIYWTCESQNQTIHLHCIILKCNVTLPVRQQERAEQACRGTAHNEGAVTQPGNTCRHKVQCKKHLDVSKIGFKLAHLM